MVSSVTRARACLAGFFLCSGLAHLTFGARFFEGIIPPWIPGKRKAINQAAGVAEICGGVMAVVPGAQRPARRYLIALLLAVFPANIHMAIRPQDVKGAEKFPRPLLWARLPLQLAAIAWVARALPADAAGSDPPS